MQAAVHTQRLCTEIKDALGALLTGRVCIVGVGSRGRHDDGAGPRLIEQHRPGTPGAWIDAGVAPENYLGSIARTNPDVVLIVDAVNFGGAPGECRLLDTNTTDTVVLSTHALSLKMLADYLSARTKQEQPRDFDLTGMALHLYNTLNRKKEEFAPVEPGHVRTWDFNDDL